MQFEDGDRVRATDLCFGSDTKSGDVGVVSDITPGERYPYVVDWDSGAREAHASVELELVRDDNSDDMIEKSRVFDMLDDYFAGSLSWRTDSSHPLNSLAIEIGLIEPPKKQKKVTATFYVYEDAVVELKHGLRVVSQALYSIEVEDA